MKQNIKYIKILKNNKPTKKHLSDLANSVYHAYKTTRSESLSFAEFVFEQILLEVKKNNKVVIRNVGAFSLTPISKNNVNKFAIAHIDDKYDYYRLSFKSSRTVRFKKLKEVA